MRLKSFQVLSFVSPFIWYAQPGCYDICSDPLTGIFLQDEYVVLIIMLEMQR